MHNLLESLANHDAVVLTSAFVAILSLSLSCFSAIFTARTFGRMLARDQRDALFKAFDSYLKIREARAKAEASASVLDWQNYYRSLFDLQWSEYYIWRERALADEPYSVWLIQHHRMWVDDEKPPTALNPAVTYRLVWQGLVRDGYFLAQDPFVGHMNAVHRGQVRQALAER